MKTGSQNHNQTLSEINITPLVDVMLVLLIIFMVTAPLISQGLDVKLPQASAPAMEKTEDDVTMTISPDGKIFLQSQEKPYRLEEIEAKIAAIYERREKKVLLVQADESVPYGTVVKAIALAKKAGVEQVGMMTRDENETSSQPKSKKDKNR